MRAAEPAEGADAMKSGAEPDALLQAALAQLGSRLSTDGTSGPDVDEENDVMARFQKQVGRN